MKRKILGLIMCGALFASMLVGCSGDDADKADSKSNDEVISEEHNSTKYINNNTDKSANKLAFVINNAYLKNTYDTTVVTLDYDGLLSQDLHWGEYGFENDVLKLNEYTFESLCVWVSVNGTSIDVRMNADRMDLSQALATDGRWALYEGNIDNAYVAHYLITDEDYTYRTISLNIFGAENVDVAKERFELIKNTVNVYFTNDNYIEVEDVEGNAVSLKEYNFIQDVVADILCEECSMYIADSSCIKNVDDGEIKLYISDDEVGGIAYEMEMSTSNTYEEEELLDTFELNKNEVKMYSYIDVDWHRYCVQAGENKYIKIISDMDNKENVEESMHKTLFMEHFSK